MAKTKQKPVPAASEPGESQSESGSSSSAGGNQAPAASEPDQIRYAFPTVSACPRCRGTNTRATSTQGRIQYRICLSAICRERYHVMGTKVN